MATKPLLLVDVDGVLSLFGFDATTRPPGRGALIDGSPHWLSLAGAAVLRALAPHFECVWCTGWEERADEHLPWLLELPRGWPHVPLAAGRGPGHGVAGHWKLGAIDAFAGPDRPLAWIDDAFDDECRGWAAAREAPTLLVECDPAVGLVPAHEPPLLEFADTLTRPDLPAEPEPQRSPRPPHTARDSAADR